MQRHAFTAAGVRYVKLTTTKLPKGKWASVYEFEVFGTTLVPVEIVAKKKTPSKNPVGAGEVKTLPGFEATIFTDVAPTMRIAREEIFGPVVSVIPCRSLDEAIDIGNGVEYGLSASIYTQDINRAFAAMRDLYTGIFYVNAPTIGAEVHLPFGGTKNTGNGHREAGTAALDVFSEWKSVYIDFSGKLQRAQIDVEHT